MNYVLNMLTENNLHGYQLACIKHIIDNPYCGIFLDMGLGKTVSTLTAINALKYDYCEVSKILVIAPKRVTETVWQEEAEKWEHLKHLTFSKVIGMEHKRKAALQAQADIYLVSRDNIAWLCALYGSILPFDMIVIDELSSFKSHKSLRFKALRGTRPYIRRLVGLTGTPSPNGLIDLWSQIYLMDLGKRLEKTITRYREKYFKPAKMNGAVVFKYKPLEESEKLIHEKISDICISMRANDHIKLPERVDNFIELPMPEALLKQYQDFEKDKILELVHAEDNTTEISVMNAAALSNKLLQFANGAVYDEGHMAHPVHDIKLEALSEILEDSNGKPVLVAWTYQFDRDRIKEYFKKLKPRELKTPQDIKDWNEGKVQLMLAHPASAGHGLNLQAGGNIIVWYGQTWSLELYQQFNARLYRQGQKNSVIINHLILKGSHDDDVIQALKNKNRTQEALMNSIKAKVRKYFRR